jgi:Zn finger protein HypA/HybF involved in hydrogenase expression
MNRYKLPISVTHPELAAEAVGWDISTFTAGSGEKVKWKCKQGHVWDAAINSRSKGRGCPFCSNKKILIGYNDLATTHPEIAVEAYEWDSSTLTMGSHKKVEWKCQKGHIWISRVVERAQSNGCPYCSGHRVMAGFNDLGTTHPEIAAQLVNVDPKTLSFGSVKKVEWQCEKKHIWSASPNVRSSKSNGCPYCSGRRVIVGETDLATLNPKLSIELVSVDPKTIGPSSHKKVEWQCEKKHIWSAVVGNRSMGNGCPYCSGHRVMAGFNDLGTTHPEIAAQLVNVDPKTISSGIHRKLIWRCSKNHEWDAPVHSRARGVGCPVCSGHRFVIGENDLATKFPLIAAEAYLWDPKIVSVSSHKKVEWKCQKGHIWVSSVKNRSSGKGCPSCAQTGFDPNQGAWLYLIENDELDMLQIGISNFPEQRITKHQRRGWEVIEVRGPMEGHLTRQLETAILHTVERRGAVLGHKAKIEKFDGYSEAWFKDSLPVDSFKQLLDWVYEDDEKQLITKAL